MTPHLKAYLFLMLARDEAEKFGVTTTQNINGVLDEVWKLFSLEEIQLVNMRPVQKLPAYRVTVNFKEFSLEDRTFFNPEDAEARRTEVEGIMNLSGRINAMAILGIKEKPLVEIVELEIDF
jgi:hypothetical protein